MTDKIKFQPGTVVATLGAMQVGTGEQLAALVKRHLSGDWGEVCKEDAAANERALKHGDRLLSIYDMNGEKLWVITEATREHTTVLTPGEY